MPSASPSPAATTSARRSAPTAARWPTSRAAATRSASRRSTLGARRAAGDAHRHQRRRESELRAQRPAASSTRHGRKAASVLMTTTLDGKIKARLPSSDGRPARAGVGPVRAITTAVFRERAIQKRKLAMKIHPPIPPRPGRRRGPRGLLQRQARRPGAGRVARRRGGRARQPERGPRRRAARRPGSPRSTASGGDMAGTGQHAAHRLLRLRQLRRQGRVPAGRSRPTPRR